MGIFRDNLYSSLLRIGNTVISAQKVNANGGFLDSYHSLCETNLKYFFGKNMLGREIKQDAKLLALFSYMTYLPYGEVGYLAIESYLKISDSPLSVAEYRFERLKQALNDRASIISDGEMAFIRDFFVNFQKDDIDLYNVMEVTSLYCRIHGAIESCYMMEPYMHREWILPRAQNITNEIADLISKGVKRVSAAEILGKIQGAQLRDEDLEYIKRLIR